jgi:predicted aconitase
MSETIERWRAVAEARDPAGLDALIADDAVFQSPVIHTARKGKAITVKYLAAAIEVLGAADFRYVEEWIGPSSAVLEYTTVIDEIEVNGVDIIGWDAEGRIDRFKVMIRPLKAIEIVRQKMAAALAG